MSNTEEEAELILALTDLPTTKRTALTALVRNACAASISLGFERARKEAVRRITNRCCAAMATHGFCEHQPCDYYHNALSEIRAMKDETP